MCAIAGLLGFPADEAVRRNMLRSMAARGPDQQGIYQSGIATLLHSRLSIIDPLGGRQPMTLDWEGERYALVYNGELYNTNELRKELILLGHQFTGHSDTEVVLHAFAQWKEDCLHKFNGIFAFGLWEEGEQALFLARDRIGVKPLFYTHKPEGFLFASEIKTILTHPSVEACLDENGIGEIILLGPGRTPGSGVFKGIYEIEPGCCGWVRKNKLQIHRYWKLTDREHAEDLSTTAEHIRFLVTDAITRQTVSDVPYGTFLSGGLDSSIITAICAEIEKEKGNVLPTFSVDYENNERYFVPGKFQPDSDEKYIKLMEQTLGTNHHTTILTPRELSEYLEAGTIARDLPGMADVDFSLLAFCKQIRRNVKMALSGECADEIFGGYPWYRDPEVRARDGFPWAQNTRERAAFLCEDYLYKLDPEAFVQDRYKQTLLECDILPGQNAVETRMKQMVNLNLRWFMQTLLDRKDRMSMYWGLEVRVPFCDYRIAEYMYAVPWNIKEYNGREKGILRLAMKGLLPEEVLWRKKSPYPKTYDPGYMELMRARLSQLLTDPHAPIFSIVQKDALQKLLNGEHAWPWYGQLMGIPQTIAYFLQVDFWLRHYRVKIL